MVKHKENKSLRGYVSGRTNLSFDQLKGFHEHLYSFLRTIQLTAASSRVVSFNTSNLNIKLERAIKTIAVIDAPLELTSHENIWCEP